MKEIFKKGGWQILVNQVVQSGIVLFFFQFFDILENQCCCSYIKNEFVGLEILVEINYGWDKFIEI